MAQLRQRRGEFDHLQAQILVISFGTDSWARAWLQETGAPFPLLLDPERRVYRAYGLGRSVLRVWSPKVVWHYLRLVLAGRRLKPIQGDPHQLGGDFIVDPEGTVRLVHPSRDPTDRPSVEALLKALRETGKGNA
ncbi:MAG: hypothetical protein A3G97_05925 [Candidatus Rokubacteria bacterium RIFCSPLOWO2_12_FULL_69_21]|nr:MAG: hypothetical protein A3G97_05925 [Candidatus Rokubacteria bacterium RIFCSPLOWO2_12_FULL_69_21]